MFHLANKENIDNWACAIILMVIAVPIINMTLYVMVNCLKKQPSAGCETSKWISAQELLPSCSEYYLVWLSDGRIVGASTDVVILYYKQIKKKTAGIWYYECDDTNRSIDVSRYVEAWQPLPEPYRGKDTCI